MAKAKYHKSQRVFVKPVGTWAYVEAVVPKWVKGCEEPIKIAYDCGMGREFQQEELEEEATALQANAANGLGTWRILRGHNRWKSSEQCLHHPYPGTHPMVVTSERDWGGWRVPGAEYDLDPGKVEEQARLIANAPLLAAFAGGLVDWVRKSGEDMPDSLADLAHKAQDILAHVKGQ